MTLHSNAGQLKGAYDAFAGGDIQPLLDLLSEEIVWVDSTLGPLAGAYHGKAEVPQFFGKMMDIYKGEFAVEVLDVLADDDYGVVLTRESGVVDGHRLSWTGVHQYSFEGGKVKRFDSFCSVEYQRFWSDRT
ncbi:MAG: nuclear transport factor 2 family protein [Acidobacteriota bacterium]|nr:nuclear transport factor 2 family protein [Acidobacteriota bacterium]